MNPHQLFIAEIVILVVELTFLFLRYWIIRQQRPGSQDWVQEIFFGTSALLCLAATSCSAWYCWKSIEVYHRVKVIVDQEIAAQARNSTFDLEHEAMVMLLDPSYRRFLFFIWGAYFTELWLLKGAFLAFYWRLFFRVQSRLIYLLYGTTVVVIITYIITLTIHFTWCTPVYLNWTTSLADFHGTGSIDNVTTLTIGSFLNVATDIMIFILPLLIVQSFNLKRRERWGLCFIFAVGTLSITASVVRYYELYAPFGHPLASIKDVWVALLWSTVEIMAGFIAFCLPSFRIVLFRAIRRWRDSNHSKSRSNTLPHVEGGHGLANVNHLSTGFSGAKSEGRNLPRHHTSLTADIINPHTNMSRETKGQPTEGVHPPNALTCEGDDDIQICSEIASEGNYSFSDEPNNIPVTNTVTGPAKEHDTAK
ncbi:hypothetical protein EV426DRAFT_703090 [Tirmania nivea]|nr:hypothetical protein EV426DRAFT_703090 [Tirmania nivea]